ncbi:MAG: hypothetical protein V2J20_09860 [Wenzhouxiangella sp.]|nr:hypothetical protein [Wenzhouxiangella sp.]
MSKSGAGTRIAWLGGAVLMVLTALMARSYFLPFDADDMERAGQELKLPMKEAGDESIQLGRRHVSPTALSNSNENSASLSKPWPDDMGPFDYLRILEDEGLISEAGAADWRRSWFEVCIANSGGEVWEKNRPRLITATRLEGLCNDVLPEGLDTSDVADLLAVSSEMMHLAITAGTDKVIEELNQKRFSGDHIGHQKRARDILAYSLDLFRVRETIRQLIQENALGLNSDVARFFSEQPDAEHEIVKDLATVWLCDRIGGCQGSDHPLVIQRCLEGGWQCFEVEDIDDAIFQSTSAFKYLNFLMVHDALRTFSQQ